MLEACLNGSRGRHEHPSVPLTPEELAVDAERCAALGVAAVHVHPRAGDGRESLRADVVAGTLTAIRAARPGLPVGVSTGAWIEPEPAHRVAAVRAWTVLPDFASVNVHEAGAEDVAAALHERGVAVEAGVWTVEAAEAYRRWRVPVCRILVECMSGEPAVALADAARMLGMLAGREPPVLLHAEGPATWSVLREAVRRGLPTRIGLEDTLRMPDGSPAGGNTDLVRAAVALGVPAAPDV